MTESDEVERQIEEILAEVHGYRRGRVFTTFAELGIADELNKSLCDLNTLATRIDADTTALRRFLDAAVEFSLVEIDEDDDVRLTELGWRLYSPSSPDSRANTLRLEAAFFERWSRLATAVNTGKRPPENRQQEDDPAWVPMFTRALFERSRKTARAVAEALDALITELNESTVRVLDLGGGHGGYSIALARRHPQVSATVFDLPAVIETTSAIVQASDVADRVQAVPSDFHHDDIGSVWDIILLFGVLHGETPDGAHKLLRTISSSLPGHGKLLIRRQGRSNSSSEPGERELFDLHMLLSTEGGQVSRSSDTRALLAEHGFQLEKEIDIPAPASGAIDVYSFEEGQ